VTALIFGALIALAAAVIVALPFLREPVAANDEIGAMTPESDRLLELMEERDRSLAALKELEFDHRTGKVDDTDYRAMVGPLRRAAAESLQELDRLRAAAAAAAS
jgi:phospholipid N-methyltransferase